MKTPFLLSSLFLSGAAAMAQQTQPNILVIIADDLGTNELGCYGGTNVQTPNIDALAAQGLRFNNNFASCAMSVPIRASLYTGLYPQHHGSYQNHKATYSRTKSVTHYLSDLGYRVGRTGKDHPVGQPAVYGFEVVNGFTVDCVSATANYTVDGITEFINRQTDSAEPFCLFVCSINSHMPWTWGDASAFNPNTITLPPNAVDNATTRNEYCKYLAEIKALDDEVGSVMTVLQNSGKANNTIVIFLGEQGPQWQFGKWTCYNYGQHSAFIARYPNHIAQGATTNALVQYEDILPTMIEAAGGAPIAGLDGTSCLPVLYGEQTEHRQWSYGIHNNIPEGTSYPIRSIQDKRWKLIVNLSPENDYYIKYTMATDNARWQSWLATAQTDTYAQFLCNRLVHRPALELYDLENDKWELNNLAALPEHATRIATMQAALQEWLTAMGDRGAAMDTENPEDPALKTPVPISSIEDIDNIIRLDLTGNYYLANDIVLPANYEWLPIGASSSTDGDPARFQGILDGRGHKISNLTISTAGSFKGLFGRLYHATVRNIDLENVNITGAFAPTGAVSGAMIGESLIERVSVSGSVSGGTEIGGIVGRVARDPTWAGYNLIRDCYVTANITATKRTTDMNAPSVAGGIAAFSHSNSGGNTGKIDIRRCYVSGAIISQENANVAGNAAGILTFYDNHNFIKMEEVIVLCDTIGAATSNLFFSRRGPTYTQFELFNKVYARNGITLHYLNTNDKGRGGEIAAGVVNYLPAETYKTAQFYNDNLTWNFDSIWTITEGNYPTLRRTNDGSTLIKKNDVLPKYSISTVTNGIIINNLEQASISVFDLSGKNHYQNIKADKQIFIPLKKGVYLVKINKQTQKIIIN